MQNAKLRSYFHFWQKQIGVSLVESLLVVVVVAAIVFLMANLPNAFELITKSKHVSLAREIVVKQIEDKRAMSYTNLAPGTTQISDTRLSLLPQGSGTINVADCDPQICPNTNGEALKKITVTITWKDYNKTQTSTLSTLIGEGGLNQ